MRTSFPLLVSILLFPLCCRGADEKPNITGKPASEWIQILKTEERARIREGAVIALGIIGPREKGVLEGFREAMVKDKADRVRLRAVLVAADFSPEFLRTLLQALSDVLKLDKNVLIRAAAATAIGKAGDQAKSALAALVDGLKDPEPTVRSAVAEAIGRVGEEGKVAIGALIPLLRDQDVGVRLSATFALGRVGSDASKAVPDLSLVLANDADPSVRKEAARAFALIGFEAREGIPALVKCLKEEKVDDIRQQAAISLGKMGPDVKPAIPALLESMQKDKDKTVRVYAVTALATSLGDNLKNHVKVLAEHLVKEPEGDVRIAIVQELGALGAEAKEALPALNRMLTDVQVTVRDASKLAIKKITAKQP